MKKTFRNRAILCFKHWAGTGWAPFASMNKKVKIGVLSAGMSILSASFAHLEAQIDSLETSPVVCLKELEVVTQRANPVRGVAIPTAVYHRKEMNSLPLQSIESALKISPVADVRERGTKGVQADLSLYGGNSDQTMMMLNGIDFTDARTGHQSHSLPIDLEEISEMTIVSGSRGIGALCGAVNVMTAPERPCYLKATVTGGDYGYGYANLSGGLVKENSSALFAASLRKSDGYTENTDFNCMNLFARATFVSPLNHDFDIQAGYQKKTFGSNGFYSLTYPHQWERNETALASVKWGKELYGCLRVNGYLSYRVNNDCFRLFREGVDAPSWYSGANYHRTDQAGAGISADYRWSAYGITSLGADYAYHHIYSNVLGDSLATPKRVRGYMGEYYYKGKRRDIGTAWIKHTQTAGRAEYGASVSLTGSPYGNACIWSLISSYRAARWATLFLSATQSMRLPTFTDLYYTTATHTGNMELSPEKAIALRGGVRLIKAPFSGSVNAFYRHGSHIIDWVKSDTESKWESRQLTSLNTVGVDAYIVYMPEKFFLIKRLSASYGFLSTDKNSGGFISKYVLDYLKNKFSMQIDLAILRQFCLSVTGTYCERTGLYEDVSGKQLAYPEVYLVDAKLLWTYRKTVWFAEAVNLLNRKYFDFGGLQQPGIWISAGVSVTLDQ